MRKFSIGHLMLTPLENSVTEEQYSSMLKQWEPNAADIGMDNYNTIFFRLLENWIVLS